MSDFVTWPSIEQYRTVVRAVQQHVQWAGKDADGEPIFDRTVSMPTLKFLGTGKLHGTNAAVRLNADGSTEYQSRSNDITPLKDNAAFAFHMSQIDFTPIRAMFNFNETLIIFGEWCGGNIQKGVAISQLPKMFVIFGIMIDGVWVKNPQDYREVKLPESRIFNIYDYPTFEIEIDMTDPSHIQNHVIDLTVAVENECPVGKAFGVSGVGEGIVFRCITPGFESPKFTWKSKGEKHSASKVKVLASIDTEKVNSIKEFVAMVVTENRLNQGIDYLREQQLEVDVKNTGVFLKWLYGDVVKEESDTIADSGLEPKEIGSAVAAAGRPWFFKKINGEV